MSNEDSTEVTTPQKSDENDKSHTLRRVTILINAVVERHISVVEQAILIALNDWLKIFLQEMIVKRKDLSYIACRDDM